MQNLVMIPALGCDGRLYADILPRLSDVVEPVTIVADEDTMAGCVQQVLEPVTGKVHHSGHFFWRQDGS